MAGYVPVFDDGPVTCTVTTAVTGGQLVEYDTAAGTGLQRPVKPASATSTKVAGVALTDANVAQADADPLVLSTLPAEVAVAHDVVGLLTYAGNAAYGDYLVAAANGAVVTAGATPAVGTIVGRCLEKAGVTSGAKGLSRIFGG